MRRDFSHILSDMVENACQMLAILSPAVKSLEHAAGIIYGSHWLIAARVAHPRPGISTIGNGNPKLQRTKTCAGRLASLQMIADLLINGNTAGPTGRGIASTLNIARQQFGRRQQAGHASHMVVPISANLVVNSLEKKHLITMSRQRLQNRLERKRAFFAGIFSRPESVGQSAVR